MELSIGQICAILLGSATVLFGVVFAAARKGRTVHPVYCAHCWVHSEKKTVVTFAEKQNRWAICPECTHHYWRIS